MGGAAGHLFHLYDNHGLTFGEIKQVLANAAEGKLERVTAKVDGMNLVFTWDVEEGQLRVARGVGDIRGGGMDAAALAAKFAGRGNVERAFTSAFKVLRQALGTLGEKDQQRAFGPRGNRWYSMEVVYAANPGTISYASNSIVFHGWPVFNAKRDGTVEKSADEAGIELLTRRIDQMQKAVTLKDWQVRGPELVNLKRLTDGTALQKALQQIDSAMSSAGSSDNDTVFDYLRSLLADDVRPLDLPPKAAKALVDRAAGMPGSATVNDLRAMVPKDQQRAVQDFVKGSEALLKRYVAPVEQAIQGFAVEVLRGVHSTLVADPDAEVARLRQQVAKAIRAIEASGNQQAMEVLQREMQRLKSVDNITSTTEGVVFFFKGQAYKLTGSFAPAHQILGLFKYGRPGIPKMDMGEAALKRALKHLLRDVPGDSYLR